MFSNLRSALFHSSPSPQPQPIIMADIPVLNTSANVLDAIAKSNSSVVVLFFTATWAECDLVRKSLVVLKDRKDIGQISYHEVLAEHVAEICKEYEITSLPSILIWAKGECKFTYSGTETQVITRKIAEIAYKSFPETVTTIPVSQAESYHLNNRIKTLLNSNRVMAFIKGTRDAPRCGFTRQLVEILNTTGVAYETFDILTDEVIRQGLKEYSNWPTYPQVYVNATLIGGLDVIKEHVALGELVDVLEGKA